MQKARRVEVNLEVSSWVEGRGVRHTDWSVRVNDSWVPIKELRNVISTMADPDLSFADEVDELRVIPPGCQYRITFHPSLPVGTRVQKRVSVPLVLDRGVRRAPENVEAAFREMVAAGARQSLALKTTFVEYRVTERGLVTEERWQRRQERATSGVRGRAGVSERGRSGEGIVPHAEIDELVQKLSRVGSASRAGARGGT